MSQNTASDHRGGGLIRRCLQLIRAADRRGLEEGHGVHWSFGFQLDSLSFIVVVLDCLGVGIKVHEPTWSCLILEGRNFSFFPLHSFPLIISVVETSVVHYGTYFCLVGVFCLVMMMYTANLRATPKLDVPKNLFLPMEPCPSSYGGH